MAVPNSGVYHLVNGPHGCGKSTALMEAVSVTPGTVYFEVRSDTFPMALAKTLSIDFDCLTLSITT